MLPIVWLITTGVSSESIQRPKNRDRKLPDFGNGGSDCGGRNCCNMQQLFDSASVKTGIWDQTNGHWDSDASGVPKTSANRPARKEDQPSARPSAADRL